MIHINFCLTNHVFIRMVPNLFKFPVTTYITMSTYILQAKWETFLNRVL